jgi:microcystin-dependent protein
MANPFLGQIVQLSFNWAPKDYALCDGDIIQVNSNAALYSLLGNKFGGTANVNFQLPDLRGRVPISQGELLDPYGPATFQMGQFGGHESVALTIQQMPSHSHALGCGNLDSDKPRGDNNTFAQITSRNLSEAASPLYRSNISTNELKMLNENGLPTSAGGNQAHTNIQPSMVINFTIALTGEYPARN